MVPVFQNQVIGVVQVKITTIKILHTPGHTMGSLCYHLPDAGALFTGDTLRLKRGSVVPSPACFNQDGQALEVSLRKLASVKGVDCLLTAHSGYSKKPAEAFAPWATVKNNQQGGLTP